MTFVLALHALMAVIWVGGMIFAVSFLRPATAALPAAERLALWRRVLARFLPAVFVAIAVLLISGYWMIFAIFGGFDGLDLSINLMQGLGWVMILVFLHVYFAPYRRMGRALDQGDMAAAARSLNQIRKLVTLNTILGIIVVLVAVSGSLGD